MVNPTRCFIRNSCLAICFWNAILQKNNCIQNSKIGGCFPNFTIIVLTIIAFGVCIVTHGIEESLILAPIYAVITVCVVSLWKGKVIILLKNIGEHSTNIWLIHMFYYLVLFDGFIFVFRYPILIYIMMFGLCMGSSFIVKLILERIVSHIKVLN